MKYWPPTNGDLEDPDRPYVNADPQQGITGSFPDARGIEGTQREIVNAITAAGLVPDGNDLSQLAAAIQAMVQSGLAGFTAIPVGAEMDWPWETPPAGWYEIDGSLLQRSEAPALFQRAAQSNLIVSEAVWLAGNTGYYSEGDGATTFRLPDVRGYSSRAWDNGRGVDAGRGLGSVQQDAMQGHGHFLRIITREGSAGTTDYTTFTGGEQNSKSGAPVSDGVNGTPRVANETRGKNIARMKIVYAGNE